MGASRRSIVRLGAAALGVALTASAVTACGGDDSTTLNVSAAASLKKTFSAIADQFETDHRGVKVTLSFDGSSTLATQINEGAPVDVFASADAKNMAKVGDRAPHPRNFATNTLVIITSPGNPHGIRSFADLNRGGVITVVCQAAQPCGAATKTAERNTGTALRPRSQEPSVTSVLTKVTTGQADAGLVYVTDARSAGPAVTTIVDPAFAAVVNSYPIATLRGAQQPLADAFVNAVTGASGQRVLAAAGFGKP